jgi:predicted ATPase
MRLIEATFNDNVYKFSPENHENHDPLEPLITVLIGANGSGKSRCIAKLANAFRKSHDQKTARNLKDEYSIQFENNDQPTTIYSKDKLGKEELNLPQSVITISNSTSDKFPLKAKVSDQDFYEYIGVRDYGLDKEKHSIYAMVDTLQEIGSDQIMVDKVKGIFEFLELEPQIWINLRTNRRSDTKTFRLLFEEQWSEEEWIKEILDSKAFGGLSEANKSNIEQKLRDPDYLKGLERFIISNRDTFNATDKTIEAFTLNFNHAESIENFEQNFRYFALLRKLNVLSYDKIEVTKSDKSNSYNLLDSSSGEVCFLSSFIRSLPHLSNNSLILIDEPEISLHPNWQMQYLSKLKHLLEGLSNVHVVIATHSPYIVSEVKSGNCWLVKVSAESGEPNSKLLPSPPYGWSIEQILLDVFGLVTTRNHFFFKHIDSILKEISTPDFDREKIKKSIIELDRFDIDNLREHDPMKKVVLKLKEKVASADY